MRNEIITSKSGNTLIELIVAIGVFVMIVPAIIILILGTHGGTLRAENRLKATAFAQQGYEALIAIKNYSWEDIQPGEYALSDESGYWQLVNNSSQNQIDQFDKYSRQISITQVDEFTKDFSISINWEVLEGVDNFIDLNGRLTK